MELWFIKSKREKGASAQHLAIYSPPSPSFCATAQIRRWRCARAELTDGSGGGYMGRGTCWSEGSGFLPIKHAVGNTNEAQAVCRPARNGLEAYPSRDSVYIAPRDLAPARWIRAARALRFHFSWPSCAVRATPTHPRSQTRPS